jgi:nucleotide-binding universal stress UspA family protein
LEEELMLETMFYQQNPGFHFLHSHQPTESIMQYAREKAIDLLFIVEKRHGFLASLFLHKHTGRFIRNASIPLCVVKQNKVE